MISTTRTESSSRLGSNNPLPPKSHVSADPINRSHHLPLPATLRGHPPPTPQPSLHFFFSSMLDVQCSMFDVRFAQFQLVAPPAPAPHTRSRHIPHPASPAHPQTHAPPPAAPTAAKTKSPHSPPQSP